MNDLQKKPVADMAALMNLNAKQKNYLFNLAVKKLTVGDIKNAADIFQLLVFIDSGNALYLKSLAGSYQAQEDYFNAYIMYNNAYIIEQEPAADYLFFMGVCLYEMKDFIAAEEKLQAYIKTNDKDFKAKADTFLKLIALEMSSNGENQTAVGK